MFQNEMSRPHDNCLVIELVIFQEWNGEIRQQKAELLSIKRDRTYQSLQRMIEPTKKVA
jgi:hypothetical protein